MSMNHFEEIPTSSPTLSRLAQFIKEIRQSHALEHATIHILGQRHPGLQLIGRSTAGGFYLYGEAPTALVASATSEALARLQAGEMALAVHPRCGTNLVIGSLLGGIAALIVLGRRRRSLWEQVPEVFLAISLALFLAQPLGYSIQERITTLADVRNVRIAGIKKQTFGRQIMHHIELERD